MVRIVNEEIRNGIKIISSEGWMDGVKYGETRMEIFDGICNIHFNFFKWSHSIFKEAKHDFTSFKQTARKAGAERLMASFNSTTGDGDVKKWTGFISHFGFPDPEVSYISIMRLQDGY